jgi:hypothetical protein
MIHTQSQKWIFFNSKTMLWQKPNAGKNLIGFEGACPDDTTLGSLSSWTYHIKHEGLGPKLTKGGQ